MSGVCVFPFEEVGIGQYRNVRQTFSRRVPTTKQSNGVVKDTVLPVDIVEDFFMNAAYTSTVSKRSTEEGATVKLHDAQQQWIKGSVGLFAGLALLFLVLLLVSDRIPKYASGLGITMGLTGALFFECERQARRTRK